MLLRNVYEVYELDVAASSNERRFFHEQKKDNNVVFIHRQYTILRSKFIVCQVKTRDDYCARYYFAVRPLTKRGVTHNMMSRG